MASTSDIRKGLCIKFNNDIYKIVDFLGISLIKIKRLFGKFIIDLLNLYKEKISSHFAKKLTKKKGKAD